MCCHEAVILSIKQTNKSSIKPAITPREFFVWEQNMIINGMRSISGVVKLIRIDQTVILKICLLNYGYCSDLFLASNLTVAFLVRYCIEFVELVSIAPN